MRSRSPRRAADRENGWALRHVEAVKKRQSEELARVRAQFGDVPARQDQTDDPVGLRNHRLDAQSVPPDGADRFDQAVPQHQGECPAVQQCPGDLDGRHAGQVRRGHRRLPVVEKMGDLLNVGCRGSRFGDCQILLG
jgi:hypothetical protein